jgi:parvulin-like peptidyl-prolyl isomerase
MSSTKGLAPAGLARMLTLFATLLLAVASLVTALIAADRPEPQVRVVEEIAAKVNGEIITRGELEKRRQDIEEQFKQQQGLSGTALTDAVNKQASEQLGDQIDQLLLVQKGKELAINVDADVNRRLAEIQSQSKEADPEKFHEWLKEKSGENFEDFKLMTKNQFLTQRVIGEEVMRNIVIPKADVEKYYNDHKTEFVRQETVQLREILVAVTDPTPDKVAAAEKKARGIVDRARKGEAKFTDLARQFSDAPTATADGDLGAFKKGDLVKDIEDVVFKQQKGYVTDPIRRPAGFEIFRIEEHLAAGQASLDEVRNEVSNTLMEPKSRPKIREYLTQLRQNAFLEIKPGYVDSFAAPGKDTTWQDALQLKPETTTKENVAAHGHKKFLKVIPYGRKGVVKDEGSAPPPSVTPVPEAPAATK